MVIFKGSTWFSNISNQLRQESMSSEYSESTQSHIVWVKILRLDWKQFTFYFPWCTETLCVYSLLSPSIHVWVSIYIFYNPDATTPVYLHTRHRLQACDWSAIVITSLSLADISCCVYPEILLSWHSLGALCFHFICWVMGQIILSCRNVNKNWIWNYEPTWPEYITLQILNSPLFQFQWATNTRKTIET